jgi:predicted Zn-dependent protease
VSRRRRGARRPGALLAAALGAALATGCLQDDGRRWNPLRSFAAPGIEDERAIGAEFDAEIREHVALIDDPLVTGYLNELGQQLVAGLDEQPFVYRFRAVRDPTLNAFAVPGGYVYLHSATLLSVGSADELAGVLGHEIAHVKAHHFARLQSKTAIPDLLTNLAGMAAAVATGEPGVLVATQAANVAMQLRFTRELETEADSLGIVYATRAGYEPAAITRFFERIVEEQRRLPPNELPPYLFSHPDVEARIGAVELAAKDLHPARAPEGGSRELLSRMQGRLAMLVDRDRASLPGGAAAGDRASAEAHLARADARIAAGDREGALAELAAAEAADPSDPRIPFRTAEALDAAGRPADAAAAYWRVLALDPTRALVFFQLGKAYAALGETGRAVFAFEQARDRAGASGPLRERAAWEVAKHAHEVLLETGVAAALADGAPAPGVSQREIAAGTPRIGWWARLSPRYDSVVGRIEVRWLDPSGAVRQRAAARRLERPWLGSTLELESGAAAPGLWSVEARIDGDLVDRRAFRLQAPR